MADIAELKTLIESMNDKIDGLVAKIDEKDVKISDLEQRVVGLETQMSVMAQTNYLLERKCDDLESYTRRQNLRIVGIPEPADGSETADICLEKVKEEIVKLDVNIDIDREIDRAHRVGPKKDRQGNPKERAMIVRFKSWRARTHVYQNRKKDNANTRFYVDLTKRRVELKKKAVEKTRENDKVSFAYADINNNICLLLRDGKKKFFNSEEELDKILASI